MANFKDGIFSLENPKLILCFLIGISLSFFVIFVINLGSIYLPSVLTIANIEVISNGDTSSIPRVISAPLSLRSIPIFFACKIIFLLPIFSAKPTKAVFTDNLKASWIEILP